MDKLSKEQRKKNMQAVKNKGSKIEITLAKAMWSRGLRYRKNDRTVFGIPDFTFKKIKIAIFCDSEFWHGYNWEERKHDHKTNEDFWIKKIERNIARDKEVTEYLEQNGWTVIRFWGNEILKKIDYCMEVIESEIKKRKDTVS